MSTLRLTTISNQDGSATVPSQTVISGSAKAWVNFNGTGTVAIRRAFNVTSITDNGTGDYTVNFTNAMADSNYCTVCGGAGDATSEGAWNVVTNSPTTTTARVRSFTYNGSSQDQTAFLVSVFS